MERYKLQICIGKLFTMKLDCERITALVVYALTVILVAGLSAYALLYLVTPHVLFIPVLSIGS